LIVLVKMLHGSLMRKFKKGILSLLLVLEDKDVLKEKRLLCLTVLLLQEVKECAISCMGLVVSTFGDHLMTNLPACLPVIMDRIGNEVTHLTIVKVC
ncbi:cullin-associated NEDD8-dissociated protein 1, partial [Tanacetum coccineum]